MILTSAWSCANSFMYAASRNLYALAITGHAPRVFAKCSARGIPIYAVCAVTACSMLSFLLMSEKSSVVRRPPLPTPPSGGGHPDQKGQVFDWFINKTTVSSLFNWLTLFLATIRFRQGCLAQRVTREDLPFKSPLMPYAAYYGCSLVMFFIAISGFDAFFPEKRSAKSIFANVGTIPWLFCPC